MREEVEDLKFASEVSEKRRAMIMGSRMIRTLSSIPGEEEARLSMLNEINKVIDAMSPAVRVAMILMLCTEVDDWEPSPPVKDPS